MEAHEINDPEPVYPDGLTPEVIERLLSEAEGFWSSPSRATSALLDGDAGLRRERRTARREMGALVRAFPARMSQVTAGHASDEVA